MSLRSINEGKKTRQFDKDKIAAADKKSEFIEKAEEYIERTRNNSKPRI